MGCGSSTDRGMGFVAEYQQAQMKKHPELIDQYALAPVIAAKGRRVDVNEEGELVGRTQSGSEDGAQNNDKNGDWLQQRRMARLASLDKRSEPSLSADLLKNPDLLRKAKSIPEDDPFASDDEEAGKDSAFRRGNGREAAGEPKLDRVMSRQADKLSMAVRSNRAFLNRLNSVQRVDNVRSSLVGAPPPILKAGELQATPPLAERGVSVEWLQAFYVHCKQHFRTNPDFTTRDVVECVVFPVTLPQRVPYVCVPGVAVGKPECMVTHAWDRPFKELVYCLRKRFQRDPSRTVWIDIFAVPQHGMMGGAAGEDDDEGEIETFSLGGQSSGFGEEEAGDAEALERQLLRNPTMMPGHVIKHTEWTLAVMDREACLLGRTWGLMELHSATAAGKLELAPYLLDRSCAPALVRGLRGLDLATSKATSAAHREEMLELLEMRAGSVSAFNKQLRDDLLKVCPVMVKRMQRTAGAEGLEVAEVAGMVGMVERAFGALTAAEAHLEEALGLAEKAAGGDSAELAAPLNTLASLKKERGDLAGAERLYRRAARIAEESFGADDAASVVALLNLADLQRERQIFDDAIEIYRKALKSNALRGSDLVSASASLGAVLTQAGDKAGATRALLHAVQTAEVMPESERATVLPSALLEAGNHFRAAGDSALSEPHFRRGIELLEAKGGSLSAESKSLLHNLVKSLGQLLKDGGDLSSAEAQFTKALRLREELLPANHPNIASSLLHVANCLKAQGKYTQAQTHFRRALTILETTLGKNHLDVASLLISLATCSQHARGEVNEADALLTRALSIRRSQLDPKHVDVVKLEQVITDLRTQ